jgi:pimeloyl-ACP methyl ester carboxylesterase
MEICCKDEKLRTFYEAEAGPANESIYQFYCRSYNRLCDRIIAPKRHEYDVNMLIIDGYILEEYDVYSQGRSLHMCHWKPSNMNHKIEQPICFVYLHTNMRSLADAIEIFPLANLYSAHVIAFDLPGCGKSEGMLGAGIETDILSILDWIHSLIHPQIQLIFWARGIATAPLIALLKQLCLQGNILHSEQIFLPQKSSKEHKLSHWISESEKQQQQSKSDQQARSNSLSQQSKKYNITAVILDSPFTSIEDMIKEGLDQLQQSGYSLSKSLLSFFLHRTIAHLSNRLNGLNLLSVAPIEDVPHINIPVCILSASHDDYVPLEHGQRIAATWGAICREQPQLYHFRSMNMIQFHIFDDSCKHFDTRAEHIVLLSKVFLLQHIRRGATEDCSTLSSVAETNSSNISEQFSNNSSLSSPLKAANICENIEENRSNDDNDDEEYMMMEMEEEVVSIVDTISEIQQQIGSPTTTLSLKDARSSLSTSSLKGLSALDTITFQARSLSVNSLVHLPVTTSVVALSSLCSTSPSAATIPSQSEPSNQQMDYEHSSDV